MLEVSQYEKKYANHIVLAIDSLIIGNGIHWFVGKNGSGKSTFFKSMAGIVPFSGKILINGFFPHENKCKLFTNYAEAEAQYPDFVSAKDILKFMAFAKKAEKGQLELLVSKLGVDLFWDNNISTYSSGMLKKISLVSGFLGRPSLIILDEPFILIDSHSIENLYELINEYHNERNVTFFLSSHQDLIPNKLKVDSVLLVDNQNIVYK